MNERVENDDVEKMLHSNYKHEVWTQIKYK